MDKVNIDLRGTARAEISRPGLAGWKLWLRYRLADLKLYFLGFLVALGQLRFLFGGVFTVECYGPDGALKWRDTAKNGVTSVGLDLLLNVMFRGTSAITTWYIGIIDNAGFSTYALADTSASHTGWSEVAGSNVSNSVRPTWSPGAPSANAIVNSSTANFNMINGSSLTVKGLFLSSSSTIEGTSGTLFSTASFSQGPQPVGNGDVLKVQYTVSASNNPSNT